MCPLSDVKKPRPGGHYLFLPIVGGWAVSWPRLGQWGMVLCQLNLGQPEHLPTKIREMENVSMSRATLAHGEIIKCVRKVLGLTWTCFYHAL